MASLANRGSRTFKLHFLGSFLATGRVKTERALHSTCRGYKMQSRISWPLQRMLFYTSPLSFNKVVSFNLTDIGEGINEVTVKEWYVKVNDKVVQFDNICEVQSDKASVTITSRYDGTIKKIYYDIDEIAHVGKPLVDVEVDDISVEDVPNTESNKKVLPATDESKISALLDKVLATPAVRRIAVENNVKLSSVTGTGKGGRILKEDVLEYLKKTPEVPLVKRDETTVRIQKSLVNDDTTVPIQGFKKAMVKSMTDSWNVPQFVYSDEILMNQLTELCSQVKEVVAAKGIKLTFMPFFIKAASKALEQYPILNAVVDDSCENMTFQRCHNIGIAMDTSNGLAVPNIKNVQQLTVLEIAKELNRLQDLGKKGSLRREDLTGGTFTLSNIGAIGGTYTKPLILPPQLAIGGLGKIQVVPRYDENDNLRKTRVLCVSWTADHRVIDGATMARFSNVWKKYVENPALLLIEV